METAAAPGCAHGPVRGRGPSRGRGWRRKSDCALAEALRQVEIPYYRGLILRKTYLQLTELMDRSTEIYRRAYKRPSSTREKHVWSFPSGAKIYFGSMQHTKDRVTYQGKRMTSSTLTS